LEKKKLKQNLIENNNLIQNYNIKDDIRATERSSARQIIKKNPVFR